MHHPAFYKKLAESVQRGSAKWAQQGGGCIEIARWMGYNTGNLSLLEGLHEATPFFAPVSYTHLTLPTN